MRSEEEDVFWRDPADEIGDKAKFKALICKLSGVPVSQYEEWIDSMSVEYFAIYCERILNEDTVKLLIRVL